VENKQLKRKQKITTPAARQQTNKQEQQSKLTSIRAV